MEAIPRLVACAFRLPAAGAVEDEKGALGGGAAAAADDDDNDSDGAYA